MKYNNKERREKCEPDTEYPRDNEESSTPVNLGELVEDFLVRTRRLLLVGPIDESSSIHICSYLQMFSLNTKPVYMYINSPGGCVSAGYAIIDQMLSCRCPIHTIIRGQAHSMGAIIAAFGQKGHRYAMPNASIMLHSMILNNAPDPIEKHNTMMDFINEDYSRKIKNLAKRLGTTPKQLKILMNETKWMSPKDAIKEGLIDNIWTPKKERSINKGIPV